MVDLEKVISDLEYYRANPRQGPLHYYGALFVDIPAPMLDDVIMFLKEQEAVKPIIGITQA